MEFRVPGVITANVTAKGADGRVDLKQTKAVVEFVYSKGVDGLHVCGSTGEFATLTVEDRKAVLEACIEAANGRGTIIAHVGSVATENSCELARHACQAGAQAVSAVPPYYYLQTKGAVFNYYRRIAEASGIPLIIYDNPGTTGFTVTVELAAELAEQGLAHGIKQARPDLWSLARFANISGGKFMLYPVEIFYLAGLATAPIVGTIGAMSNWIPEALVGIRDNFTAGNLNRAAELQRLICELISSYINAYSGEEVACTKALLEYRGVSCGDPWESLLPLTEQEKKSLFKTIDAFNLDFDALAKVI